MDKLPHPNFRPITAPQQAMVDRAIGDRLAELTTSQLRRLPFGGAVFVDLEAVERGDVTPRDIAIVHDRHDLAFVAHLESTYRMVEVATFVYVTTDLATDEDVDERPASESSYLAIFMALDRAALLNLCTTYAVTICTDVLRDRLN